MQFQASTVALVNSHVLTLAVISNGKGFLRILLLLRLCFKAELDARRQGCGGPSCSLSCSAAYDLSLARNGKVFASIPATASSTVSVL